MLEKAMIDGRKPTVIARIALYLYDIYEQCTWHLENSGIVDLVSNNKYKVCENNLMLFIFIFYPLNTKEFVRLTTVKCDLYAALTNYYLGCIAEQDKKMGARLI